MEDDKFTSPMSGFDLQDLESKAALARMASGEGVELSTTIVKSFAHALWGAEMGALRYYDGWTHDHCDDDGRRFRRCCSIAFDLRRAQARRRGPLDASTDDLRTACAGILGERWDDAREYLERGAVRALPSRSDPWRLRLALSCHDSFLNLLLARDEDDLAAAGEQMRELLAERTEREREMTVDETQPIKVERELGAYYQLASGIQELSFLLKEGGDPGRCQRHFDEAVSVTNSASILDLFFNAWWMRAASHRLLDEMPSAQ